MNFSYVITIPPLEVEALKLNVKDLLEVDIKKISEEKNDYLEGSDLH